MTALKACLTRDQSVDRSKNSPRGVVPQLGEPCFFPQHNMPCAAQLLSAAQYTLCGTTSFSSTICLVRHNFFQQHNMPCALCSTTSFSSTICLVHCAAQLLSAAQYALCGKTSFSSTIRLVRHNFFQQHNMPCAVQLLSAAQYASVVPDNDTQYIL